MICDGNLSLFDLNNNNTIAFLNTLIQISNAYGLVHKYLCLIICIFGSFFNVVHIFVLTRPIMQKCAVNRLLSIIAICDICTMLSYLIFVVKFGLLVDLTNPPPGYAFHWIVFLLAHVVWSIALHTITLYLSCVTAYIRYKTLKKVGSKWNHQNAACPIFLTVATIIALLCIPTFLLHTIIEVLIHNKSTGLYTVALDSFSSLSACFLFKLNLWMTGIVFKVIPCCLLFMFTVALLWELELSKRRRQLMTSGSSLASRRTSAQSDRTTKVLIVLLIIFLCTEFPQGILAILNGIFPNDIHQFIYLSLGEILDLLSLINCNTCFIVYPLLSSQYCQTLRAIFHYMNDLFKKGTKSRDSWQKMHDGNYLDVSTFAVGSAIHSPNPATINGGLCTSYSYNKGRMKRLKLTSSTSNYLKSDYYGNNSFTTSPTPTNWSTSPAISPSLIRISESENDLLYFHDNETDILL